MFESAASTGRAGSTPVGNNVKNFIEGWVVSQVPEPGVVKEGAHGHQELVRVALDQPAIHECVKGAGAGGCRELTMA